MSTDLPAAEPIQPTLAGREILVAVCGGIAAYKTAEVVSKLVQRGGGVTVAMTKNAAEFVGALTFQALSRRPVHLDTFRLIESSDPQHLSLTERADVMLIAPATNNIIAKAACGICDDLVSTLIAAAACPVVYAPAMNVRMWENPILQDNIARLSKLGHRFIGPEEGWLACRAVGKGRMSEPQKIVEELTAMLQDAPRRGAS